MKKLTAMIGRVFINADKLLLLVVLGVSALSITLLCGLASAGFVQWRVVEVQGIAVGLGTVGALFASAFDPDDLARLWKLYMPPILLMMILTYFFGTGREGSDNISWLDIGFISIQPSEFLKIGFIMTFALHLSRVHDELDRPKNMMLVLCHGALPVLLVLLQSDDGVTLIMAGIVCAMLFMAGFSRKLIAAGVAALVVGLPVIWFGVLSDFQRQRFMVVFNPNLDPQGMGYQQLRGLTAMGSGQVFGNGIFNDSHIYVPENYNDFIFTFLGESLGFVGCFLLLVALAVICGRILQTGILSKSYTGKYICVGVFAMIAIQSVINISMCLMIMPVIGVTLPLMSAGGSSVLSTYAGIGLVLCVYSTNNKNMFSN
ncbi:MAG: FtsW/RodA/SpoVE family cell cycle protein [Angelakisella sp.]